MENEIDVDMEVIASEKEDLETPLAHYDILTYPTDFTLEVLYKKLKKAQIVTPAFQRKYVWTQTQASKLIESFLHGLPVPPIYIYQNPDSKSFEAIDGQQRLKTIKYFFDGIFGEGESQIVFKLVGLNPQSPYNNKTYKELEDQDPQAYNKLNDAVLRAFVIKENSQDVQDTSIVHIFERLNTGGTILVGQEVRNCIYHGTFSDLLGELNQTPDWRSILGKSAPDKRQRDIELILRFFSLFYNSTRYYQPMKDFMSSFMKKHKGIDPIKAEEFRELFLATTGKVIAHLGKTPFKIKAGLNAAVFDSVFTAFAKNTNEIPNDIQARYKLLISNADYLKYVTSGTTALEVVKKRLELASALFN
jgi:hypothetical protein